MITPAESSDSRRSFLKKSSAVVAASSMLASSQAGLLASEDNMIQLALVGCGGRGTGAAKNALTVDNGPVKLVAMADVMESRMKNSFGRLDKSFGEKGTVDVPEDRRFLGFDAYKQAMDCLEPGDIVLLTTPAAFRWVHYTYASGGKRTDVSDQELPRFSLAQRRSCQ